MEPLRLMIFDRTCTGRPVGLSDTWFWGAHLYRALGRFDGWRGVATWEEGLRWLAAFAPERPIAEVQFWGHGRWGLARIGETRLDRTTLDGELARGIDAVRDRLTADGLWWFRTCETFGAQRGQDLAQHLADRLGCDVAGHTFIIGAWQSGLHRLAPGAQPQWSSWEGLAEGTPAEPVRARWSWPRLPYTISCLRGDVPSGW